jgi:proline iminopeptidase
MGGRWTDVAADVAGGSLRGWRTGSGPPVLVLHGGPGLSDYTAPMADELHDRYTVYRYQQRGLAPSTTDGPFTVDTHVDDAVGFLDAMDVAPCFLIGHSWGGHLAMHIAAGHADLLLGLVVVDPLGIVGDGGESDMGRIMTERMTPDAAARATALDERAMRGEGTPGDAMEALALVWPSYFAVPSEAPPMPPMQISLECHAQTWDSIHHELARQALAPRLAALDVPTTFVLGADSPIPAHHGLASAAVIPGATTVVLDGCGHFPWLERPGVVRRGLDAVADGT